MASGGQARRRFTEVDSEPLYKSSAEVLRRFLKYYEVNVDVGRLKGKEWNAGETEMEETREDKFGSEIVGSSSDIVPVKKYQLMVERVVRKQSKVIDVWVDDVERWREKEEKSGSFASMAVELRQTAREMPDMIENNTMRYMSLMEEILDEMVREERQIYELSRLRRRTEADRGQASSQLDANPQTNMETQNNMDITNTQSQNFLSGGDASLVQDELLVDLPPDPNNPESAEKHKRMLAVQAKLKRTYEIHIIPRLKSSEETLPLRMVRAQHVGKLVTVQGIVTRVTEVKPMIVVATYICDTCNNTAYQLVNEKTFMPIKNCESQVCKMAVRPGKMRFYTRGSKFSKFQQIKLQELSHHVPIGHIPRTLGVHVVGELTRKTVPGDVITVKAIFLPISNQGFNAVRNGIVADTFMLAQSIDQQKKRYVPLRQQEEGRDDLEEDLQKSRSKDGDSKRYNASGEDLNAGHSSVIPSNIPSNVTDSSDDSSYASVLSSIGIEMSRKIDTFLKESEGVRYKRLAQSIAPEIYGHEDVKKAMLLQMVGGVTRVMEDGMRNRGDINICLMGDPGVAKSQLLKHIQTIAPRAVYTSGKGSTGVGLTAAILRDPVTKEFVLEGGSLTIADMGICCIDEFDKMDEADRTAIHEVMEQQTISIAKAGITTTLNARTAVLAAANPAWGRYNPRRSPTENINLPASLLSRFDLLFLILDRPDSHNDRLLAQHITHVHRNGSHPPLDFQPLDPNMMRAFISLAKSFSPFVPADLNEYIVSAYCSMRSDSSSSGGGGSSGFGSGGFGSRNASSVNDDFGYTSARSLLAILRLSQALARLRFSNAISKADIDEAIRLMNKSKNTLLQSSQSSSSSSSSSSHAPSKRPDDISSIYNIIREFCRERGATEANVDDVSAIVLLKGFSQTSFDNVLDVYDKLGVWSVSANRQIIRFTM